MLLLALLAVTAAWVAHSNAALRGILGIASQASGGRLQIGKISGTLSGPLAIEQVLWQSPELRINISAIDADWQPAALLRGKLAITTLSLGELRVDILGSSDSTPPAQDWQLPLALSIEKLAIHSFDLGGLVAASEISARLHSDAQTHQLDDFVATLGLLKLSGKASLAGQAPHPLQLALKVSGHLDARPLHLAINAAGPLARIALDARGEAGISGSAQATLTPFAAAGFADARLALDGIDLSAWLAGAPRTDLALRINLQPAAEGLTGDFSLSNRQPGALDRQKLPLEELSGQLDGTGAALHFSQLSARLSGGGRLQGSAEWQDERLHLALQASRIDALALHTQLRKTQLGGRLDADLGSQQQGLNADLSDPRFRLKLEAAHNAGRLTLPLLELAAGNSLLKAAGELRLDAAQTFNVSGELSNFDPRRFFKAPAALLNSRFSGHGQLAPRPQLAASFQISNSHLAGAPLAGQGELRLAWPVLQRADITLNIGENQLKAHGAFGRAGDALEVVIQAPRLAPLGVDGDLDARVQLAGSINALQLSATARASRLGRAGSGQIKGLMLKLDAATRAAAPIALELAIARIDSAEQDGLLNDVEIQVSGNNHHQTIVGSGRLADRQRLALRLAGGLDKLNWRGEVQAATLSEGALTFSLSAPAPLSLAAEAWSIGPARLAGSHQGHAWQASLQAAADKHRLHAELGGHGPRLGEVSGQIDATMRSAWAINDQAPWLISLSSRSDDLGWLAALAGEPWKSGGRLNGQLKIAGTPAQPVSSGQLRGQSLRLQNSEYGLHLDHGELAIDLGNNLLRIIKLDFDSILQKPPSALLRERSNLAALAESHGRLGITGEMRVDRQAAGERAALDLSFERVGVYQRPDAWVLVSGNARLSIADEAFGILGKLTADAGYWQLADAGTPRLSDDVVIKVPERRQKARLRPKLEVDVSADLGKNFLFSGAGLRSRLTGDVRLRASGRDLPRATGSIRSRDGRFEAYGQQLEIERGILSFQGLLDNPALDVRAVRKGLAVEAGVQVSGTAQKPRIRLISDPELPDPEKLSWLVLGHGPEQMGAGDASVLLSAAGSILGRDSGGIVKELSSTFGIDEFGLRQGQIGDTGSRAPGSRVAGSSIDTTASTGNQILSVGKRLSSNALLSYEQALGEAESVVKLTVNLTREISIIGRAGSDNALDIFYTISFGKPPRSPRGKKAP